MVRYLYAVHRAHRNITREAGRLVEQGTQQELLRVGGRYARLFNR